MSQTIVNLNDVKHRTEEKSLNSGGIGWGDISGLSRVGGRSGAGGE